MKEKKKILSVLAAVWVTFLITSCDLITQDFLEEDSRTEVSDVHLSTEAGLEEAVNACYSHSRYFIGGAHEANMTMLVAGTDTWIHGFGADYLSLMNYDNNLNGSYGILFTIWSEYYRAINTCNTVITRAPEIDMDENLKNTRVAEARYMRALYYFMLVKQWGPVHISLEETVGVVTEATRSSVADVYDVIIGDLEFAAETLPIVSSNYGRATKPATEDLLAKVYLTRANHPDAQQPDDYENAANLAEDVINNYHFRLLDTFTDVFDFDNQEHEEVVWAIQQSSNSQTDSRGNQGMTRFNPRYERFVGLEWSMEYNVSGSAFRPSNFTLYELWDDEIDSREEFTVNRVWYTNEPETGITFNGYEVTLAVGDTALYLPKEPWSEAQIAEAGFSVINPDEYPAYMYPALTAKWAGERSSITNRLVWRDVFAARLAETHLIAAEAHLMMGNLNEAATHVNTVRRRAARQGATEAETEVNRLAMEITPAQLDIDFILDERARELIGELKRWEDLTRTGKLVERVRLYNPDGTSNIEPHHVLRPIPQNQIDRTSSPFPQNPGYPGAN
ncbi:MAG: RagB/SusD family nutrient uptake outer membrane protein [Balneolaceae bacterium]